MALPFSSPRRLIRALALMLPLVLVAACSSDDEVEYVERPVERIYNEAVAALQAGAYDDSARLFDEVERQHPYSVWATKAQLMAAYSYYMQNAYDQAIVALDRFIQLHPSNKDVPYAYYLKALCYYEQISDVARDQKMTDMARKTLRELITRYPQSKYTRDAKLKFELTEDHLAGKEIEIGRYYQERGHHLAAINRFQTVVDQYQTTTHVPEALHRLVESYLALGLVDEAKKTASVLGHNFQGSEWYVDSYEMLKGEDIRPAKDTAWYDFWGDDDEPRVRPLSEEMDLPVEKADAPPLAPGDEAGDEGDADKAQARARTGTAAGPETDSEDSDEPWWKLW